MVSGYWKSHIRAEQGNCRYGALDDLTPIFVLCPESDLPPPVWEGALPGPEIWAFTTVRSLPALQQLKQQCLINFLFWKNKFIEDRL